MFLHYSLYTVVGKSDHMSISPAHSVETEKRGEEGSRFNRIITAIHTVATLTVHSLDVFCLIFETVYTSQMHPKSLQCMYLIHTLMLALPAI